MIGLRDHRIVLIGAPDAGLRTSTERWVMQYALTRGDGFEAATRVAGAIVRLQGYLMPVREPGTLGIAGGLAAAGCSSTAIGEV